MKNIVLIIALLISAPAQAATTAPPDTTTRQEQPRPTTADFGNLKYKTDTPDCTDAIGHERRRVIGNAVFIAAIVAVVSALIWGAVNQANAPKQPKQP